ncbi:hypothetical protein G3I68_43095, partial [Streptomyces sp. SID13588]|nr:hypothetical protein [Streptomyces sp. SID13588]
GDAHRNADRHRLAVAHADAHGQREPHPGLPDADADAHPDGIRLADAHPDRHADADADSHADRRLLPHPHADHVPDAVTDRDGRHDRGRESERGPVDQPGGRRRLTHPAD